MSNQTNIIKDVIEVTLEAWDGYFIPTTIFIEGEMVHAQALVIESWHFEQTMVDVLPDHFEETVQDAIESHYIDKGINSTFSKN